METLVTLVISQRGKRLVNAMETISEWGFGWIWFTMFFNLKWSYTPFHSIETYLPFKAHAKSLPLATWNGLSYLCTLKTLHAPFVVLYKPCTSSCHYFFFNIFSIMYLTVLVSVSVTEGWGPASARSLLSVIPMMGNSRELPCVGCYTKRIPKWYILGWHTLIPFTRISGNRWNIFWTIVRVQCSRFSFHKEA